MSKDKIADYDGTTAGNNTDIGGISIAEGMLPSAVNNSMRELTKQLGAFANGTDAIDALDVTGAATVGGAFTSPGIDDNANATAITIDSSENVLIDKTSSNYETVGHELRDGGRAFHTADGGKTLSLNRLSSDGGILDFYKDNSEVGTIGTSGSQSYIHGAGTDTGLYWGSNNIYPYRSTGLNDNTIDLGQSSKRFKDLYLGGNLYLGGTGSANALDDYEFGDYDITLTSSSSGSITPNSSENKATYVKIGNFVQAQGRVLVSSVSSPAGDVNINLPFNTTSSQGEQSGSGAPALFVWDSTQTNNGLWVGFFDKGTSYFRIRWGNSSTPGQSASYIQAGTEIRFSVSYITDS